MNKYDHNKIEKKWQKEWVKTKLYKTVETKGKKKFYVLDMFPYPSGEGLHVGHPRGYIGTDIVSRMKKMQGFNILHPMGFDSFGLPAEQYAIKNKIHPEVAVKKNIKRYKEQLAVLGFNYDWDREVVTSDPAYYKWTQWIFLKMFEKGLAFESFEPINWCPSCQTGLANEDLEQGHCERCGTQVEKKPMRQWVLKITKYADRMLEDLDALDWPTSIKESQRNWIGRSEGAEIEFPVFVAGESSGGQKESSARGRKSSADSVKVFTTRADTLYGATYIVLAPEHELVKKFENKITNFDAVKKYIEASAYQSEIERAAEKKDKTGVELKGIKAINPANGEEIPVWIADYVLAGHGTGAIMAVPAHDDRDYEFAKNFNLLVRHVIFPRVIDHTNPPQEGKKTKKRNTVHAVIFNPARNAYLTLKWKKFPWNTVVLGGIEDGEDVVEAALREIKEETGFIDLEFKKILGGPVEAHYFAAHKDENRVAVTTGVYFEMKSEKSVPVSDEEKEQHEVVWRDPADFIPSKMTNSELPFWLERMHKAGSAYSGSGYLIDSGEFSNMDSDMAKKGITKKFGKAKVSYKLKDWVFARQRYWGEPIPLIHCLACGVVPVPEKDLPVKLPKVKSYEPTGTGESPLATIDKWVNVKCPKCGGPGKRETNTMPQWAGSSWYYLRYIDPKNRKYLVDKTKEAYWSPVDLYVGGTEHATRHLIYARFWHKFLFDIGVVNYKEPFMRLQNQGLIMASDGRKMSKRWGNVVNPDDVVKTYGADTMRVYEMFMGPFDQSVAWNTDSIMGSRRFLEKVWRIGESLRRSGPGEHGYFSAEKFLVLAPSSSQASPEPVRPRSDLDKLLHKTIKKVSQDIESMTFNTAISSMMILANEMERADKINTDDYKKFLQILSPFAPHMTEEIWSAIGEKKSIYLSAWPEYDKNKIKDEMVKIAVQVNGRVRAEIEMPADSSETEIKDIALSNEAVKNWINGQAIKRFIYVKGKLVSIVV